MDTTFKSAMSGHGFFGPFYLSCVLSTGSLLGPPVLFTLQVPIQFPEPPLLPGSSLTKWGGTLTLNLLTYMLPLILGLKSGNFF